MALTIQIEEYNEMGQNVTNTSFFVDGKSFTGSGFLPYKLWSSSTTQAEWRKRAQQLATRKVCNAQSFAVEQNVRECLKYYDDPNYILPDSYFRFVKKTQTAPAPTPIPVVPNDEITAAAKTQSASQSVVATTATSTTQTISENIKSALPIQKDPNLLAKEKEAEALKKKAEIEKLILERKEEIINKLRVKLNSLKIPSLPPVPFPPKKPILDPKILQALLIAKQAKQAIEERQKKTRDSLKKAEKTFEYPLTPDGGQSQQNQQAENLPIKQQNINSTPALTPPPTPTPSPVATRPIRSKFSIVLNGGGHLPFDLVFVKYDFKNLDIVNWPIPTTYAFNYSYNNYELGSRSVRAYIQDQINRGVFDNYVKPPY
jgi:hypothetical protein